MTEKNDWLAGKAVVITGAGRGVGAAIARLAADQGAAVVVNDLDAAPAEEVVAEIVANGGTAVAHAADVSDHDAAGGLIQRAIDEFGALDGLVNNAGVFRVRHTAEEDHESYRRALDINVMGTVYPGLHAIRHMVERGEGSIVNVTSGAMSGLPTMSAYGTSKGAVASLTYGWAVDLQKSGVRVNALSPLAYSRMTDVVFEFHGLNEAERARDRARLPKPTSNAPAVVYLLSDRSFHVNGQVVQIRHEAAVSLLAAPGVMQRSKAGAGDSLEGIVGAFHDTLEGTLLPLGFNNVQVRLLP